MNTKDNKTKNIQRIVDFWTEKVFNTKSSLELNSNSEKVGQGAFVWSNVLSINSNENNKKHVQDFKTVFANKIEKHYPHIHISSQGTPRGVLKETFQDLNMDIKPIGEISTWIENDILYFKEGNTSPKIIDSDGPTISS